MSNSDHSCCCGDDDDDDGGSEQHHESGPPHGGEENLFTELEQVSPRGVQVEDCTEEQLTDYGGLAADTGPFEDEQNYSRDDSDREEIDLQIVDGDQDLRIADENKEASDESTTPPPQESASPQAETST